ncbi:MAG: multidrug efflux SMR transporter [Candidatus Obscuribacterales bacterium]|nr:multidrug efflux SMR transporter [Candidatus Obscuribacterales bacterium]
MSWFVLFLAGLFEVAWAVGFKWEPLASKPWAQVAVALSVILSMVLLAVAVKQIPLGTAYAVWTGIGVVGTVVAGALLFGEPLTSLRLLFVALILAGTVGLKLTSAH